MDDTEMDRQARQRTSYAERQAEAAQQELLNRFGPVMTLLSGIPLHVHVYHHYPDGVPGAVDNSGAILAAIKDVKDTMVTNAKAATQEWLDLIAEAKRTADTEDAALLVLQDLQTKLDALGNAPSPDDLIQLRTSLRQHTEALANGIATHDPAATAPQAGGDTSGGDAGNTAGQASGQSGSADSSGGDSSGTASGASGADPVGADPNAPGAQAASDPSAGQSDASGAADSSGAGIDPATGQPTG